MNIAVDTNRYRDFCEPRLACGSAPSLITHPFPLPSSLFPLTLTIDAMVIWVYSLPCEDHH